MLRVDLGKSVRRTTWRLICKDAPRLVGVCGEPGAVIHLRYDPQGFTVNGSGASRDAELACARAILDGIEQGQGMPALPIFTCFLQAGVN